MGWVKRKSDEVEGMQSEKCENEWSFYLLLIFEIFKI